jgi:malonate-semialdehyde dehydrogenase (acetylating)/methylmalonate-semialdehyde dehydrogenase
MADILFNSETKSDSDLDSSPRIIQNYINGKWVASSGTETVEIINPANGSVLALCPLGSSEDVDQAVAAAREAFKSWRQTPVIDRVQPLFRLKALFEDAAEDLARQVTQEHGKTLVEARGSVRRGIQMIETACGMPSLLMGEIQEDIAAGIDSQSVNRPMGVFSCIAPFNFPAMVPMWFWPFAIACGNTFVLKPSERVPLTQLMMFELIEEAGVPAGVLNMVQGAHDVVNSICTHPDIEGVSFVGSTPVAKHVYETGCAAGKRVQALGGAKNFMVVLPDAVMDKAAATATESIIGCAGERCLAGSVIVNVGEGTLEKIQPLVMAEAEAITVGDGLEAGVDMGPVISADAKERIVGLIERAIDEGAELLVDGRIGLEDSPGYFLKPTVLGNIRPEMEIAQVEVPCLPPMAQQPGSFPTKRRPPCSGLISACRRPWRFSPSAVPRIHFLEIFGRMAAPAWIFILIQRSLSSAGSKIPVSGSRSVPRPGRSPAVPEIFI